MLLKVLQLSQENACVGVSFYQSYRPQVFSSEVFSFAIFELFKNTYFVAHLQTVAYDGSKSDDSENDDESYNESIEAVVRRCSSK